MANKSTPSEYSALKSITLIKSVCDLFVEELPEGAGQIVIGLDKQVLGTFDFVNEGDDFSILVKLDVTGYAPNSDEKVFNANCSVIAKYGVVCEAHIQRDELKKSMDRFSGQIYPFVRSIVVNQMTNMGINGLDAPWDMSTQFMSMEPIEPSTKKKVTKKKVIKKKASKKKTVRKKV